MQLFTGCRVGCCGRREPRPEVSREWEMLGPQFPHLQNRDANSSLGEMEPGKEDSACAEPKAPGAQQVAGWEGVAVVSLGWIRVGPLGQWAPVSLEMMEEHAWIFERGP